MTEQGELARFVARVGAGDLSALLALRALVASDDGVHDVPRQRWVTAVAEEYRRWYGPTPGQSPENFPEGDTLRYLDEHVVALLTEAGVVQLLDGGGDPAENGAWAAVRLPSPALEEVEADRGAALEALDARIRAILAPREGRLAAVTESLAEAAPPEDAPAPDTAPGTRRPMLLEGGKTLSAKGLVKSYRGRRVVNEVDIHVSQGEIVGLLGPNGAGKTTSFYMIVGLIRPDRGKVYVGGEDLTKTAMYRRARTGIGYLSQEPSIFRRLTVEQNVMAILQMLGLPKAEQKRRLEELLDELALKRLRKSKAYALSGGERRRLEITRALVGQPKFMLLDEPFAGVDPIAVHDIQQIVSDLRRRGIGVLISDHNVEQTLDIVDRAYIMYDGRVRVSGTVSELVWSDEVAEIYLGPTLTARMRERYPNPFAGDGGGREDGGGMDGGVDEDEAAAAGAPWSASANDVAPNAEKDEAV
ncbi:MAG TPA: LPS export ABC transporter ATP-binding protein [Longimicrobium sp.]|nr:LPS export ABC transporter ATP-binding protein [Longimicrobium sp.]